LSKLKADLAHRHACGPQFRQGEHEVRDAPKAKRIGNNPVSGEDSAKKSARLIKGAKAIYYPGAPHGLTATHQESGQRRPAGLPADLGTAQKRTASSAGLPCVWMERTMNPADPADTDLVTLPSAHDALETVERLKALLAQKGIEVFAHSDHAAGARTVGLPLRPTQVLIIGSPKSGTPLMQSRQTTGLDLPLRVLIWENGAGKAWLTYRRVADRARQHRVTDRDEAVQALDNGLARWPVRQLASKAARRNQSIFQSTNQETQHVQDEERPSGGDPRQGGRAAQRPAGRLHRPADANQAGALEREGPQFHRLARALRQAQRRSGGLRG
jgi:uncharacterized protein (DUF302 family)